MSVDLGVSIDPVEIQHTKGAKYSALVDTGAKRTSVDIDVAENLGFTVETWIEASTAAGVTRLPVYKEAMIHVPCIGELRSLNLVGANLRPEHSHDVLIGRDLLAEYQMIYDGRTGRVTLSNEASFYSAIRLKGVGGLSGT